MLPRRIVLRLLAAAFVLAAVRSMATILAGGGPPPDGDSLKSECYLYAEVAGTHPAKILTTCPGGQRPPCYSSKFLVCTDGDPTCDQDGTCNGVCVFRARVCTRLPPPTPPQPPVCTSPPALKSIKLNRGCPLTPPATLTGSVCGAFVDFDVPLRGSAKRRASSVRCVARGRALAGVRPPVDVDVYSFRCTPCSSSASAALLPLEPAAGD
jgi:hypothetical protein